MLQLASHLTLFIGLLCTSTALCQTRVESLTAKGAVFKKDKAGVVTEIRFADNSTLTPDDWKEVGKLTTLTRASISRSDSSLLNDETAKAIAGLDQLEHFFSNGAEVSDEGMKAFANWKKLRHFGFDHWGWREAGKNKSLGAGIAHLAAIPTLESIRLGGCRVDNSACEGLAKIKQIQSIDLFHCYAVTDEGIAKLTSLPKLKVITLGPQFTPRITDRTLEHLSKVASLEQINITETWLTYDAGFVFLKKLPNLKVLNLKFIVADEKDIAKLKADCPKVTIDWTMPDDETTAKTKERFQKAAMKPVNGK